MKKRFPDSIIFICYILLLGIGINAVYSSSYYVAMRYGDSELFLKRQILWAGISLLVFFTVVFINYNTYKRYVKLITLGALFSLLLVLIPGIGREIGGAKRWIRVGIFNFQPSEMVKLAVVIYLSAVISSKGERINRFVEGFSPPLIVVGIMFSLVLIQSDFSTAIVVGIVAFVLFFVGGVMLKYLLFLIITSIPMLYLFIMETGYRKSRLLAFMYPNMDPLGKGYQLYQSLKSFHYGGVLGVGIGEGFQKMGALPLPYSDFIYSVIAEESGFVGAFAITTLYFIIAWRGVRIAAMSKDRFAYLLAAGITSLISIQAFINMLVVTGLLPTTGLPLPFISYGGSSLLFSSISIGILLNISMYIDR